MKTRTKKGLMRTASGMVAAVMLSVNAMSAVPVIKPIDASAGTISNLVTGKFAAIGLEYFERAVMRGLTEAATQTQNEAISEILTKTKRVLSNPTSNALSDLTKLCKQIDMEVKAIDQKITANNAEMSKRIEELKGLVAYGTYSGYAEKMGKLDTTYSDLSGYYNELITAANNYCNDQSEANLKELQKKYATLEVLYNGANGDKTVVNFNFANDCDDLAMLLSPYNPSTPIDYSVDVSDSSKWGAPEIRLTYISSFYEMVSPQDPFDHQLYSDMSMQYTKAATVVYHYLNAYELYILYASQKIYSTPVSDLGISTIKSEKDKSVYIERLWDDYNKCAYKLERALAQMVEPYDDLLSGAMREYDINSTICFNGMRDQIDPSESYTSELPFNEETSYRNKTSDVMETAQVRPAGSNTTYYFRQNTDTQPAVTVGDLYYHAFDIITHIGLAPTGYNSITTYTCDYYNLFKATPVYPAGLSSVSKESDLLTLIDTENYTLYENDLMAYLNGNGVPYLPNIAHNGSSDMSGDALKAGQFLFTPEYEWFDTLNYDIDFRLVNVSKCISKDDCAANAQQVMVDAEDTFRDNSDTYDHQEVLTVYKGEPEITLNLGGKSEHAEVKAVSRQTGAEVKPGDNTLKSGDVVELKIKPEEGYKISALRLGDKRSKDAGNTEDKWLLQQFVYPDDEYGPMSGVKTDSDGYYCFDINVPFRDAYILVDTAAASSYNTAQLVIPEKSADKNGELMFGDLSDASEKLYAKGDTVTIDVLPYEGKNCTGIKITDKDGNVLSGVSASEVEKTWALTPTAKEYTFTMPDKAVKIEAKYGNAYAVELDKASTDASLDINFSLSGIMNDSWQDEKLYFAEGETVSISAEPVDSKHYVSKVKAVSVPSMDSLEVKSVKKDGKTTYSFTMPASDVSVSAEAKEYKSGEYGVQLEGDGLYFTDADEKGLSYVRKAAGETVNFMIDGKYLHDGYTPKVRDAAGSSVNYLKNGDGSFSFTMPASDVVITLEKTGAVTHFYENGICKYCGKYEKAEKNSEGFYEITNAGNFLWFAGLVNNDHADGCADFAQSDRCAKAVLTDDIDLENRSFMNIGDVGSSTFSPTSFGGVFDGQGHTISNFSADGSENHTGMFGCCENAEIKDLTVKGTITANTKNTRYGLILTSASTKLSGITSYVDIKGDQPVEYAGGICAVMTGNDGYIDRCVNFGDIDLKAYGGASLAAGICASQYSRCAVTNCANIAWVRLDGGKAAGIAADLTFSGGSVENCYNYYSCANEIVARQSNTTVKNCFDSKTDNSRYRSGEIGYLLNNGVTDGTQAWYQDIDNGKGPDNYPLPYTDKGTIYQTESGYSNYDGGKKPEVDDVTIDTYDELVAFAGDVANSYSKYGASSVKLGANIKAPDDSVWSLAIGSEDKPFNGTFDGQGYVIIGLNVDIAENGGLFGVIGEKGIVKDLMVLDCDFNKQSALAGGIAAVNNGRIDHCTSGHNLDPKTVLDVNGKKIKVSDYNSNVTGTKSGGIAAVNNGTITGSRTGAYVSGPDCGGIAYENNGSIYGCANNGSVGTNSVSCKSSGGLTNINNGEINSSYNSGKVNCYNKKYASVAVVNNSDKVNSTFYSDINGIPAVGDGSKQLNDSNKSVKNSDMLTDAFVETLASVTDDTVRWHRAQYGKTYFNQGYPTIKGRFLEQRMLSTGKLTVKGLMHKGLNVSYAEADGIEGIGDGADRYYKLSMTDKDGNYVPGELWCGGVSISVPVSSDSAEIKVFMLDGSEEIIVPVIENGIATFELAEPLSFAVDEDPRNDDSSSQNDSSSRKEKASPADENPATGTGALAGMTAMLLLGAVMVIKKREANEK